MSNWTGTVIGPGRVSHIVCATPPHRYLTISVTDSARDRIYNLSIHCGEHYPDVAPEVKFISRVNLPFVDQTNGKVDLKKIPTLGVWHYEMGLETLLVEIRK